MLNGVLRAHHYVAVSGMLHIIDMLSLPDLLQVIELIDDVLVVYVSW